jgi:hypothetical protein
MLLNKFYTLSDYRITKDLGELLLSNLERDLEESGQNIAQVQRSLVLRGLSSNSLKVASSEQRDSVSAEWVWNDFKSCGLVKDNILPLVIDLFLHVTQVFYTEPTVGSAIHPHIDGLSWSADRSSSYRAIRLSLAREKGSKPSLYVVNKDEIGLVSPGLSFWSVDYPTLVHGTLPVDYQRGVLFICGHVSEKFSNATKVPMFSSIPDHMNIKENEILELAVDFYKLLNCSVEYACDFEKVMKYLVFGGESSAKKINESLECLVAQRVRDKNIEMCFRWLAAIKDQNT